MAFGNREVDAIDDAGDAVRVANDLRSASTFNMLHSDKARGVR